MVPCDVLVPRAKGMFVSPDGGVAQLGATVTATVTAVTTLASPALSSAHLTARFMLPPNLGRLATGAVGGEQLLVAASLRCPPSPASVRGMRRGCDGAGWWFIGLAPSVAGRALLSGCCRCPY